MKSAPKKLSVLAYQNVVQGVKVSTQVTIEKMDPSDDEELSRLTDHMRNLNVSRCERIVYDSDLMRREPMSMGWRQCRNRKPKSGRLIYIAKMNKHVCDAHAKQYDSANEDNDYERINSWKWIHDA